MTLFEKEEKRQRWFRDRLYKQAIAVYEDEFRSQKAKAYNRQQMKKEMHRLMAEATSLF